VRQVKGAVLNLKLFRGHQDAGASSQANPGLPVCKFVNIQLCGGSKPLQGTVLLENPRGTSDMTLDQLRRQVQFVIRFGPFLRLICAVEIHSFLYTCIYIRTRTIWLSLRMF